MINLHHSVGRKGVDRPVRFLDCARRRFLPIRRHPPDLDLFRGGTPRQVSYPTLKGWGLLPVPRDLLGSALLSLLEQGFRGC